MNRNPCEYNHNSFRFTFFPSPVNTTTTKHYYRWFFFFFFFKTCFPLLCIEELSSRRESKNKRIVCGLWYF
jgi:hypothetical protein